MNPKVSLALLLILAVAGGVFYYSEVHLYEQEQAKKALSEQLFDLNLSHLTSLRIEEAGSEPIVFKRDGETWQITEPQQVRADQQEIASLIQSVKMNKVERELEGVSMDDLQPFGLQPPVVTVTASTGDATAELRLGSDNPTKTFVYAQKGEGEPLFLTSKQVRPLFEKDLYDYRHKQVFDVAKPEIEGLRIERVGAAPLELELRKPTTWWITSPREVLADQTKVGNILNAITNLEAQKFVTENADDDELAARGLDEPILVVTALIGADKAAKSVALGEENALDGTRYARRLENRQVVEVLKDFHQQTALSFDELRDRKVADIDQQQVHRITLENSHGRFAFAHEAGTTWRVREPRKLKADYGNLMNLVQALRRDTALKILESVPEGVDPGFNNPAVVAEFFMDDRNVTVTIGSGMTDDGNYYARNSERDEVYVVPPPLLQAYQHPLFHFRDKLAFTFQRKDITKFELRGPSIDAVVEKVGDDWEIVKPENAVLDETAWNSFLSTFGYVYMTDIVHERGEAEAVASKYGLDPPVYHMVLTNVNGSTSQFISFGEEILEENKVYGTAEARGIFKVNRSVLNAFPKTIRDIATE